VMWLSLAANQFSQFIQQRMAKRPLTSHNKVQNITHTVYMPEVTLTNYTYRKSLVIFKEIFIM